MDKAHSQLLKQMGTIINNSSKPSFFNTFLNIVNKNLYAKALRMACNNINYNTSVFELIELLLSFKELLPKEKINEMVGKDKLTPLHYAAINNHVELYNLLKRYGADDSLLDAKGNIPESYWPANNSPLKNN